MVKRLLTGADRAARWLEAIGKATTSASVRTQVSEARGAHERGRLSGRQLLRIERRAEVRLREIEGTGDTESSREEPQ